MAHTVERQRHSNNVSAIPDDKTLLGKYEMGRLLGCGAFAKVYHARNISTGQSVAIKVINKKRISNPGMMSNITREITIMRKLHHRHIVKLYEVSASKTKIYFVMEFVKGGELFAKISKGRFSEDLSRKYFQQLIAAVGYCHSRGVFHRDLKPENLLLDENGDLKVSDFGLSAVTGQIHSDGLLHTLCGTPAYVAPEVLRRKGYNGAKVDVWSCGVILFVLTAGYLPFNDPNLMAMYKKIYKGEYRCPKYMSIDLKRLLSRILDTNPETRITIDGILKDPWFRKGGLIKQLNFNEDERVSGVNKDEPDFKELNAFDIISFSSGLNLSGLLDDTFNPKEDGERIVLGEMPEKLVERIQDFCAGEKLRARKKKEWGFEMEGQNGNLWMAVDIFQLTDGLAVVEAKRNGGDAKCYREVWLNKMKPMLLNGDQQQLVTPATVA